MVFPNKLCLLFYLLVLSIVSPAQEKKAFSTSLFADYSIAGASTSLTAEYRCSNHVFYLGYKHPLQWVPGGFQGKWGTVSGYRYIFHPEDRLATFLNLDYQLVIQNSFRYSGEPARKNYLHQAHFSYGLLYRISEVFSIGNSIGAGIYFQNLYSRVIEKRTVYKGYDGLIRVFLTARIL